MTLPAPYYEDARNGIVLYCGDCLDILPHLTGIDAVVTDPPYNVGLKYGPLVDDRKTGYRDWCQQWVDLLSKIEPACMGVSCGMANIGMWATEFNPRWFIAWNKPAAMGRCCIGFNNWEPIAFFGKPSSVIADSFSACIVPDESVAGHPCPKPVGWALWQVEHYVNDGGMVLDCFSGSGTTLVACLRTGRRGIGIELDPHYCEIAAQRLKREAERYALIEPVVKKKQLGLLQ